MSVQATKISSFWPDRILAHDEVPHALPRLARAVSRRRCAAATHLWSAEGTLRRGRRPARGDRPDDRDASATSSAKLYLKGLSGGIQ